VRSPGGTCRPGASSLRVGGGDAPREQDVTLGLEFSPRRRRWCGGWFSRTVGKVVLSAQAEVVRVCGWPCQRSSGSLRVGGGGAAEGGELSGRLEFSPRRRRWCGRPRRRDAGLAVLSAQAEVVRPCSPRRWRHAGPLRVGGGDAELRAWSSEFGLFSPRTRRWCLRGRGRLPHSCVLSA